MSISFKVWLGLILIGLGVGGLVYAMPQFSKAVASKGPVFSEADVPHIPDNTKAFYIPLEAASAALIAIEIAIAALGHSDTFAKKRADIIFPSEGEVKKIKDSKTKVSEAA